MEKITQNARETQELGARIGNYLKGGEVICLFGEMGAGKTTFVQGLSKSLNIKSNIQSPTFIIMRKYIGFIGNFFLKRKINFYHVDLYRIDKNIEKEVENLGILDLWGNKKNIFVIEWSEKIENILPKNIIKIKIKIIDNHKRSIIIENLNL